jgi:hypothetical protein
MAIKINGEMVEAELLPGNPETKTMTVGIKLLKPTFIQKVLIRDTAFFVVKQPPLGVLEKIGEIANAMPPMRKSDLKNRPSIILDRISGDVSALTKVLACLLEYSNNPSSQTIKIIKENLLPKEMSVLIVSLLEFADLRTFIQTFKMLAGMGLNQKHIQNV